MTKYLNILLSILLLTVAAIAQGGNTVTIRFAGAPSGSCSPVSYAINSSNGDFYDCVNGAWVKVGQSGGGGPTINPTTGVLPYKSGASAFDDSPLTRISATVTDTGTSGVFTWNSDTGVSRDAAGVVDIGTGAQGSTAGTLQANALATKGTTAGVIDFAQGTTNVGASPCTTATSVCLQAPTAVTSYSANLPAAAPTNNNSAMIFTNASPAVGSFAKIPQTVLLTSQYTNSTTGFTNVTGGNSLAFSVEANTNYVGDCTLFYQAASTGGLNIEFTGPASPTAVVYSLIDVGSATTIVNASVATSFSSSLGAAVTTAATNFPALVHLALQNGANAGTLQLLAKSSASVQLQIQNGSFCRIQ